MRRSGRMCRGLGASLCMTEFVGAEQIVADSKLARRRAYLARRRPARRRSRSTAPTRDLLMAAATIAEAAQPAFIDINCGCWVPKIARRGAGAGWLRNPTAMVAMAQRGRRSGRVAGDGQDAHRLGRPSRTMPIVDLARRLEDAGVAALTIHCRTAEMGHAARPTGAGRASARERVAIPVIVNGDVAHRGRCRARARGDRLRGRDDRPRARSSIRGSSARRARGWPGVTSRRRPLRSDGRCSGC